MNDAPNNTPTPPADDVEQLLADALATRATDVEATPHLWQQVQAKTGRARRAGVMWGALGGLAAAGVAAIVASVVLQGAPTATPDVAIDPPTPTLTAEPSEQPTGDPDPTDGFIGPEDGLGMTAADRAISIATDGSRVYLVPPDRESAVASVIYDGDAGDEIVGVVANPMEPRDVVLVVRTPANYRFDLLQFGGDVMMADDGTVTWIGDGWQVTPFPADKQPRHTGFQVPLPHFSPEGDYLAWVEDAERAGDEGAADFRVIGWDRGPGTGDTATDNAAFVLDGGTAQFTIIEWTWTGGGQFTAGELLFRTNRPPADIGAVSSSMGTLIMQADGAISDVEHVGGEPDHGSRLFDRDGRWYLQNDPQTGGLALFDVRAQELVPLPKELRDLTQEQASSAFMAGNDDAVVVGHPAGGTWRMLSATESVRFQRLPDSTNRTTTAVDLLWNFPPA